MPEAPALRDVQAWMLAAITGPEHPEAPQEMVRSTPGFGAAERLEAYRRGYRARLVETMRAQHPALRHALGDEVFDAFALDYLAAKPSRSYTLTELGAGFADHLEATRPDGDETWPDFLIDLARLERAFVEVYDGPGAEGARLATPEDVRTDTPLRPVPCLRLLTARFPVAGYMRAVRRGESPPLPSPRPAWIVLSRRDYEVTIAELEERDHALLRDLAAGAVPGAAVDRVRRMTERGWFLPAEPTEGELP